MNQDSSKNQPLVQTNTKNELILEPSLQSSKKIRASWIKRTFAPMRKGGIRGNIFLMMVTTTGCAFFYLPIQAKKTGLILTIGLLMFVMSVSYYSSRLLYLGFKATKASTYDQCMNQILGTRLGFLSNFMIFIHTFAATVSVWLFSFDFLFYALKSVSLNHLKNQQEIDEIKKYSFYGFSIFMGILLYISSIFRKINFLKKLSMIGIFIIFYLLIVFLILLPQYYEHYKSQIDIIYFKFDHNFFITNGICFYLFLNQYTVLPICSNLKKIRSQRIFKVIKRTDTISFFIYILFTLIGYFSMPNTVVGTKEEKDYELFLIRPAINGQLNKWVTVGQFLFGINLIIAVLVKGHFLCIYFEQIISNITKVIKKILKTKKHKIDELNQIEQQKQEISEINYALPTEVIQLRKKRKQNKFRNYINIIFFSIITLLAICLEKVLHIFVSIVGSFVGVFEIVVFPLLMILIINSKQKILGTFQKIILITISILFALLGFASFITTLIYG